VSEVYDFVTGRREAAAVSRVFYASSEIVQGKLGYSTATNKANSNINKYVYITQIT
jgi:hypothetical protein